MNKPTYEELEAQVKQLAAENAVKQEFISICFRAAGDGGDMDGNDIQELGARLGLFERQTYQPALHGYICGHEAGEDSVYVMKASPATDAILASLRAEGVEMFANHQQMKYDNLVSSGKILTDTGFSHYLSGEASTFAAQLRSKSSPKHADPVAEIQIKNGDRDLFEEWVMSQVCISKSTLEGLRTESGYRNSTLSGKDYNQMWLQWNLNSQLRSKSEVQS